MSLSPAKLDSVTVTTKANIYFDGRVTSRTVEFADGRKLTLGILLPGMYEFGTGAPEVMEITTGRVDVQLAGEQTWTAYGTGTKFSVSGNSKFTIAVREVTDYVCHFLPA